MRNDTLTKLIVLAGVLGISTSAIFARLSDAPSLTISFWRMILTVLLMSPVVLTGFRGELTGAGRRDIFISLMSGIFLGFHFCLYLESLKHTTIAASTVLVDMEVVVIALVLTLVYREHIPHLGVAGIVLAFAGSIVIAAGDMGGANALLGDALAFGGTLCSAMYTLIGRSVRRNLSTTVYTYLVYLAAGVTVALGCLVTGTRVWELGVRDIGAVVGMVVCCTLLGHSIFSYALGRVSAAYVSMAKLGEPVLASIIGLMLFHEVPALRQIMGGVLVLAGIALYLVSSDTSSQ